jgi:hypothetical protein
VLGGLRDAELWQERRIMALAAPEPEVEEPVPLTVCTCSEVCCPTRLERPPCSECDELGRSARLRQAAAHA